MSQLNLNGYDAEGEPVERSNKGIVIGILLMMVAGVIGMLLTMQ